MELIELVNSVIIFLFQTTLLRLFLLLLTSLTVSHSPALLDLFFLSDSRIFSTVAFPLLGNSNHVVVPVSNDFA